MNIKQGYLDIYKELSLFLEVNMANKKIKKNVIVEESNNKLANFNKNKTLYENTFNNEETNHRTFNDITKIDNNRNYTNTSLINFSNSNIYNVIRESESILNEIKPIIIDKSSII